MIGYIEKSTNNYGTLRNTVTFVCY